MLVSGTLLYLANVSEYSVVFYNGEELFVRLQILECFLTITERRAVSNTTRCLRLSRPSLSHRLVSLRGRLKGRLFIHNGHGVALARSNRLLHEGTVRVVSLIRGTRSRVRSDRRRVSNGVCVNNDRAGTVQFVTRATEGLRGVRPCVRCRVCDNGSSSIVRHLSGKLLSFNVLVRPVSRTGCSSVGLPARSV